MSGPDAATGSVKQHAVIRSAAAVAEFRAHVSEVLRRRGGGTTAHADGWETVRLGSRARFRMWGLWGLGAGRRLPILVRTRVGEEAPGSALEVELSSDEGWYVVRLPAVDAAYRRMFGEILTDLGTLPPVAETR